jgi:hypothetical protein
MDALRVRGLGDFDGATAIGCYQGGRRQHSAVLKQVRRCPRTVNDQRAKEKAETHLGSAALHSLGGGLQVFLPLHFPGVLKRVYDQTMEEGKLTNTIA